MLRFPTTEPRWRPSEADWAKIKQSSVARDAQVAIVGLGPDAQAASSSTVRIRTSTDPVGDSIFYREVPLPFLAAVQDPSRIRWRFGSVDSETAPPIVLENLPVCGNCHSFSGDGKVLGLDVDYGNDKGAYAVLPVSKQMVLNDEKIISWSDYKKGDGEATFGLLSRVSPDGRYVISTVKDRAVFVATPDIWYSQLFFPIKGILVVYDTRTGSFKALPGADDPEYVQSNPTWSPDGKSIVFARTKAYKKDVVANATSVLLSEKDVPEFVNDKEPFKFDLYRVPFNDGRGGKAEPIEGASHNGKSNYFAKFSPDGKWIIFCKAENYMLLMPDSELLHHPGRRGRGSAPARKHAAHELLAQLVVERPLARLLFEGQHRLHAAFPDPHRREGRVHAPGIARALHRQRPRRQHPGVRSAARRSDRADQGTVPRRLLFPSRGHGERTDRRLSRRGPFLPAGPGRRARERRAA